MIRFLRFPVEHKPEKEPRLRPLIGSPAYALLMSVPTGNLDPACSSPSFSIKGNEEGENLTLDLFHFFKEMKGILTPCPLFFCFLLQKKRERTRSSEIPFFHFFMK